MGRKERQQLPVACRAATAPAASAAAAWPHLGARPRPAPTHPPLHRQSFDGRGNDYNLAIETSCGWAAVEVRRRGWAGWRRRGVAAVRVLVADAGLGLAPACLTLRRCVLLTTAGLEEGQRDAPADRRR